MPSQVPVTFTVMIVVKSARLISAMRWNRSRPALLTSTSSLPNSSTAVRTVVAQSASLVTSWCR
jgi:hypothetical protein